MKQYLIPLIEGNKVIDTVTFEDNLTDYTAPPYVNYNGQMGLTRLSEGKHSGELVIMYFFEDTQEYSYAEFISDREAFRECAKRNKLDLAHSLDLKLVEGVEVL